MRSSKSSDWELQLKAAVIQYCKRLNDQMNPDKEMFLLQVWLIHDFFFFFIIDFFFCCCDLKSKKYDTLNCIVPRKIVFSVLWGLSFKS